MRLDLLTVATLLMCAAAASGEKLRHYDAQAHGILGLSIGVDCEGTIYAVNNVSQVMHVWRNPPDGPVTIVPTRDSTNTPVSIVEISWDADRGLLWGTCCWPSFGEGVGVYTITSSGLCVFQFHVRDPIWPFGGADGLAYDPDTTWPGGSLWLSWDQNNYALHYTATGEFIERVELPMEGSNPSNISGICATPYGLWCARYGKTYHCITLHEKTGGPPIPQFTIDTSPFHQNEGLECECGVEGRLDSTCVLWVKDVGTPQTITAYRVPSGSRNCSK